MAKTRKSKTKKNSKSIVSDYSKFIKPKPLNPFELKINRQKHDVLGRKISKHEVGKPLQSRKKAIKKRKETLLVEYNNLGKSNSIIDRRLGEYDRNLTTDQKQLRRWAKARKYNLADSDEELGPEETLTQFNQASTDADHFDGFSDDSDDGKLSADIVAAEHFGSGHLPNANKQETNEGVTSKTHYERMQEILKKKNEEKLRRDIVKEQMQTKREQLDEQLKANWNRIQEHMKGAKERFENEELARGKISTLKIAHNKLLFEKRGTPSERLKTQEQSDQEAKERLNRLETERLQRMMGEITEEKSISVDALTSGEFLDQKIGRRNKRIHESGSDEENTKDGRSEDILGLTKDNNNDNDSIDDSNEEERSDRSDEEESDDLEDNYDDYGTDLESSDEDGNDESVEMKAISSVSRTKADKEILKTEDVINQFEKKLSSFCEMLASYELPSSDVLSEMTLDLIEIGTKTPVAAGQVMCQMIEQLNSMLCSSLPRLETLLFLKLVGSIFPTSDRKHPVTTPAMLLMSKMLNHGIVRNCREVVSGLFLVTLLLEFVSLSKRFVPDAINFLTGVLFLAADRPSDKEQLVMLNFRSGAKSNPMKLTNCEITEIKVSVPLNLCQILSTKSLLETDELRVNCLAICLDLAAKYRILYGSLPAVEAIFAPIKNFVEHLNLKNYPIKVKELSENLKDLVSQKVVYQYLVKAPKKPHSIKQLEPKIYEKFDGRKKLVGPQEWRDKQLASKKCKKMKKDAERELRKDQRVLQGHIIKETLKRKMIKDHKVKNILSSLASQEGEWRSMKKGKKTDL